MSHSLKVVRIAAVFCAITSCCAILRRRGDRWCGLLFLICRGWRSRLLNFRHHFADFYFLALVSLRSENAIGFSHDFGGNLIGLQSKKRIAFLHLLARFLVPDRNDTARNRFTDGRDFYLHAHARLNKPKAVRESSPSRTGVPGGRKERQDYGGFIDQVLRIQSC